MEFSALGWFGVGAPYARRYAAYTWRVK